VANAEWFEESSGKEVRLILNIVLVGMSGAGKSTLGVLLAKAIGMDYVDTDIIIQKNEGRLLQEIIDNDGIEKFMQIEEGTVSELQLENCIISTGGSVIYSEKAMTVLKQHGQAIYLHVAFEEIKRRLINVTTRGIVIKKGNSLKDVYEERVPLYLKYSDKTLNCSDKDIEQCVGEIIELIKQVIELSETDSTAMELTHRLLLPPR
jgi:shikimate kinase